MERKVGGGIGMGNTCKSMADSCQCMTKPLQYCKVISLQLIKINEIKKCADFEWKLLDFHRLYFNRRKKNPHVFKANFIYILIFFVIAFVLHFLN